MTGTREAATTTTTTTTAGATLVILAGGEGRRMGTPKAQLRVAGKPILAHLLDRFAWPGPTLLVTAPGRERPPGCERFDREVADPVAGEGPLLGVLTALGAARTEIVVVTTCDMPRIGPRQLGWLLDSLAQRPLAPLVMLSRGDGPLEPFPFAIRRTAMPSLGARFAAGERAMRSLLDLEGAVRLAAPVDWDDAVWMNLNAPQDVAALDNDTAP